MRVVERLIQPNLVNVKRGPATQLKTQKHRTVKHFPSQIAINLPPSRQLSTLKQFILPEHKQRDPEKPP